MSNGTSDIPSVFACATGTNAPCASRPLHPQQKIADTIAAAVNKRSLPINKITPRLPTVSSILHTAQLAATGASSGNGDVFNGAVQLERGKVSRVVPISLWVGFEVLRARIVRASNALDADVILSGAGLSRFWVPRRQRGRCEGTTRQVPLCSCSPRNWSVEYYPAPSQAIPIEQPQITWASTSTPYG